MLLSLGKDGWIRSTITSVLLHLLIVANSGARGPKAGSKAPLGAWEVNDLELRRCRGPKCVPTHTHARTHARTHTHAHTYILHLVEVKGEAEGVCM